MILVNVRFGEYNGTNQAIQLATKLVIQETSLLHSQIEMHSHSHHLMRLTEFHVGFVPYSVREVRVLYNVAVENPNHNRSFQSQGSGVDRVHIRASLHRTNKSMFLTWNYLNLGFDLPWASYFLQVLHPALLFLCALRVGRSMFSGTIRLYI